MTAKNPNPRAGGLLLHPTSLPGSYGIGDLGPVAYAWVDSLVYARQKLWQILPLGPTSYGDSPYQSFSAFAGNPLLVSPEVLMQEGLVDSLELGVESFPLNHVDYGRVLEWKKKLLGRAWSNFKMGRGTDHRHGYQTFLQEQSHWIGDFALFMAIKDTRNGQGWFDWPLPLRLREAGALESQRKELQDAIGLYQFSQYLFFRQWGYLRRYANQRGLRIIGDIPIFVAADSAEVWANPQHFLLDNQRRPTVVAGVPPDYFSATGQLWGNPLYDWSALKKAGYRWWVDRLRSCLALVDIARLDHFRGFESYWEVPAGRPNAIEGRWVPGPGVDLFETLKRELGGLPIIAEDLGIITPEVEALRDHFQLPGMRVLQFAFGGEPDNPYLPHNYLPRTVAYTGTHDNDTTRGWFQSTSEKDREHVRRYLGRDGSDIAWDFIRTAWSSVADFAVAPIQDVLNLGNEARMNSPGKADGNWSWRLQSYQLTRELLDRLAELTILYGRT